MTRRQLVVISLWLCVLGIAGAAAVLRVVRMPASSSVAVDTQIRSGNHVVFVVIAPHGPPQAGFGKAVSSARQAFRDYANRCDCYFTTIGVSNEWDVDQGVAILERLGPFDEMIIGRNWFNTGISRFVTELGGRDGIPQVVGLRDSIRVRQTGWDLISRVELGRFLGPELIEWLENGSPIPNGQGSLTLSPALRP